MSNLVENMTRAEKDAQTIRQRDEQIQRLQKELQEYIRVQEVLIAARVVGEERFRQAHELVQTIA